MQGASESSSTEQHGNNLRDDGQVSSAPPLRLRHYVFAVLMAVLGRGVCVGIPRLFLIQYMMVNSAWLLSPIVFLIDPMSLLVWPIVDACRLLSGWAKPLTIELAVLPVFWALVAALRIRLCRIGPPTSFWMLSRKVVLECIVLPIVIMVVMPASAIAGLFSVPRTARRKPRKSAQKPAKDR